MIGMATVKWALSDSVESLEKDTVSTARTESLTSKGTDTNQLLLGEPNSSDRQGGLSTEVPRDSDSRRQILSRCREAIELLPKNDALSKRQLEVLARSLLSDMGVSDSYVGWTMVVLSTEHWRDRVAAVPMNRRLLLLPKEERNGKRQTECVTVENEAECRCEQCAVNEIRAKAELLGYRVAVVQSSEELAADILASDVEAIVGVASLNVLEKAMDRMHVAEIPSLAIPLNSASGDSTSVDRKWAFELIERQLTPTRTASNSYLPLLRAAQGLFEPSELTRLISTARVDSTKPAEAYDPVAATANIAHRFLCCGGKYARPFITLAAYDAMRSPEGSEVSSNALSNIPDAVRRVALSIETFHKASLIHDDIEDSDDYRYGQPALHTEHGLPAAINIGDYMIGLGYRLISREIASLGPEVAGDILDMLANAHLRLCEGQGAELLWRDKLEKQISPSDALAIYALKTAPAFEVALLSGMRCAGSLDTYREPLKRFSECLGIAFQILNDLKDWKGDDDNKLGQGFDTLGGRPTVLWALALEGLDAEGRSSLLSLQNSSIEPCEKIEKVRKLYQQAGAFAEAHRMVVHNRAEADAIANQLDPPSLQRLLHYLLENVLK